MIKYLLMGALALVGCNETPYEKMFPNEVQFDELVKASEPRMYVYMLEEPYYMGYVLTRDYETTDTPRFYVCPRNVPKGKTSLIIKNMPKHYYALAGGPDCDSLPGRAS